MKVYSGSRGSAPLILTPVTRWRKEVNTIPPPFYYLEKKIALIEKKAGFK